MYSEKEIAALLEPIIVYYSDLETDLILDICRRLNINDKLTGTAEWKLKKLQELGALKKSNIKKIAIATRKTEKQITDVITDIGLKALSDDDKLYNKAFTNVPPVSKQTKNILASAVKAAEKFQNLLGSNALESSVKAYRNTIERIYLEVNTGAVDYNSAIKRAVSELSDKGLTGMTYKSDKGKITRWNLDTAVRQMLLDSTTRTVGQMQLERANQMQEANPEREILMEVSSHMGERPSHAEWSGRLYSLKDGSKYPNFYKATHYGERSERALHSYNCKHIAYTYIEGLSERTFEPQPKAENQRVYKLRTQQRYNERQIRKWKREADALQATGDNAAQAKQKVKEWQAIQRDFLKKNDILKRDYARERI